MKKFLFSLGALFTLAACSQGPFGLTWNSPDQKQNLNDSLKILNNSYRDNALSVINQNCVSCHGQSSGPQGIFNLLNLSHLVSSGLVVPGNPDQSPLYTAIKTGSMPLRGRLSENDQNLIRDWIAASNEVSTKPVVPVPLQPTFANIESKILQVRCVRCHAGDKPKGQVALDTYEGVMKVVNLQKPEESSIYDQTYTGQMPPRGDLLSVDEQKALLTWIQAGAPNN